MVDYNYAPADDLPDDVDFDGDASWMGSVAAAAAIGTGAAIVAYQFGTTVYLDSVLPEGADIPVTYGQLAKLMWQMPAARNRKRLWHRTQTKCRRQWPGLWKMS